MSTPEHPSNLPDGVPAERAIVFLGPSMSREEAKALLPDCEVRSPARRGDLYEAHTAGYSLIVLIDGVFRQERTVSPREIVDVLDAGATVFGAASLGAMRAAECWPAGMHGIGTIYRLFRRGSLQSDDEVATVFNSRGEAVSIPLINIRYALSRAIHGGMLDREVGERIVSIAEQTFYSDRTWKDLFERANLADEGDHLRSFLEVQDLKRLDARRALLAVGRHLRRHPWSVSPSRHAGPASLPTRQRERGPDATAGQASSMLRLELARWHLHSGRFRAHALAIMSNSHPEAGWSPSAPHRRMAATLLTDCFIAAQASVGHRKSPRQVTEPEALHLPHAWRLAVMRFWAHSREDLEEFSVKLWAELLVAGELDAELFRWRAIQQAQSFARQRDLKALPLDRHLAESEILLAHEFLTWKELNQAAISAGFDWSEMLKYRDQLATSKRVRRMLFASESRDRSARWPS